MTGVDAGPRLRGCEDVLLPCYPTPITHQTESPAIGGILMSGIGLEKARRARAQKAALVPRAIEVHSRGNRSRLGVHNARRVNSNSIAGATLLGRVVSSTLMGYRNLAQVMPSAPLDGKFVDRHDRLVWDAAQVFGSAGRLVPGHASGEG